MDKIEEKEIRGLSFKTAIAMLISTVSIVASIVFTYTAIINKMDQQAIYIAKDKEINELTHKTLSTRLDAQESMTKYLQGQVDALKSVK